MLRRWFAALPLLAAVASAQIPRSSLSVQVNGEWRPWWSSDDPRLAWEAPSRTLISAIRWTSIKPGVEYAELHLAGTGEAWRTRVILVRIDPAFVSSNLVVQTREAGTLGAWAVDSSSSSDIVAMNAGQFRGGTPWGWLVRNSIESRAPGVGPLSMAVASLRDGKIQLVSADSIAAFKSRGDVVAAFQSYPTLLEGGGVVPEPLRTEGRGVDLEHRDSRLAIGELRDGRLMIALTRFEGLGGVLSQLPFGPTIPEMSALMGALGCTKAVALDGGISGQLMLKSPSRTYAWRAYRRVPLGLVFTAR